jgi:uncharacterized glyoxalase superfamily protein PhnB
MAFAKPTRSTIIPGLLYHDAPAAIAWLGRAFGFEPQLVVPNEEGGIAHAQLVFGNGMIMLGSAETNRYPHLIGTPRQLGVGTTHTSVCVSDADAHYAQAIAAGAEIVGPLEDKPYGGRGYSARDPEGHVWHFGTYDPWDVA